MFRTETGNLVERMIRDEPDLIGLVTGRMWGRLVVWSGCRISARLKSRLEPEDIAQDILARVISSFSDFHGTERAAFYAWFFRIARNTIADAGKAAGARKRQERELPGVTQTSPSMHVARLEAIERMTAALGRLAEADRTALSARYLEELSYAEVAEVLGCSTGAARVRVCRALGRLKPLLDEQPDASGGGADDVS